MLRNKPRRHLKYSASGQRTKGQHVRLRTGVWEDPAAWGVMLSDLMHHIAGACYETQGLDPVQTVQRIKEGLVSPPQIEGVVSCGKK
jgi:hypothetical protein